MYINDLIKITKGYYTNIPKKNTKINHIKLDSRQIEHGDVFVCINSGVNYIEDAIKKGCSCIISEQKLHAKTKIGIIKVDNIKDTLLSLGFYIRKQYKNIPVIAITGSVGKSSTKYLINSILTSKYKVLMNEGNKNNYIGVSETIFKLDNSYDIILLELGMNHSHEIDELSMMIKPDLSIITNIGTSHIGNLGSKKDILEAKLEIINGMDDICLIVPPNDPYLNKLKYQTTYKCYDIDISHIKIDDKLRFDLKYNHKDYVVRFKIPNKKYIDNILLAFKTGTLFNIDEQVIIDKINTFLPLDKRMNIIEHNCYTVIDDCYNSSYESLLGDLDYIKRLNKNKLIILGSILELGKYSKKIHKQINQQLKKIKDKEVLLVGEETKVIEGMHFNNNDEIKEYLKDRDLTGYVILLKGSRLMKLEEIRNQLLS